MEKDKINSFQFLALAFVCTLSPIIHTLPDSAATIAGDRAWISCCLAVLPGAVLCAILAAGIKLTRCSSLCCLMRLNIGEFLGRILCISFSVWFIFLSGFILRAEGQRFVSTAYPLANPKIFAFAFLLLCVPAVFGHFRSIARVAMVLRPLLALVLVTVFVSALPGVKLHGLWQPSRDELGSICLAAFPAVEPMCFSLYLLFFGHKVSDPPKGRQYAGLIFAVAAVAILLCITVLGTFGSQLSLKIYAPFFSMVRDVELFGDVDRIEAVVTAVWVFSDFVVTSALLCAGAQCLNNAFPGLSIKFCTLLCCACTLGVSLILAPASRELEQFTRRIVPLGNLFALLLISGILVICRMRAKTKFG